MTSTHCGLMSVGHVCLDRTFSRELVLEPQLDQKKISTSGFLHCRAQSESKGPFPLHPNSTHRLEVEKKSDGR